jgi:mannose-6-phosphate isomerase
VRSQPRFVMVLTRICERGLELRAFQIEKPWGRTDLPYPFVSPQGGRIGEVWFEHPAADELPLLVKYIFTSEKLSVQVHPDDEQARARGLQRGKSECWYVLDAEEDARIGVGLAQPLSASDLRAAALDGSIEELIEWRRVAPGDFLFVPAGTIHAIGAGISLLEFQQNADATYRLYDYGRPRELHLEEAVEVVKQGYDWAEHFRPAGGPLDTILIDDPHFSLVRASSDGRIDALLSERLRWVMPLHGSATAEGVTVSAGGCLLAERGTSLSLSDEAVVLVGAEGPL